METNTPTIKGYKVFNPDWTCRGFQYEVGETYTHEGEIEPCEAGFHFCQKASDCFNYYSFDSSNKVAEVEAIGIVKTEGNKSVTDKIKIIREIEWQELLTIVNEGKNCTGLKNTGSYNSGNCNSGDYNEGNYNSGNYNSCNYNSGDCNAGNRNVGNRNAGDYNVGDRNAGSRNVGYYNVGSFNVGSYNVGSYNVGSYNSGDWNSTCYSTGFFNSKQQPIYMFNKPVEMDRDSICNHLRGLQVLNRNFRNVWWIYSEDMTEEEKTEHPEYKTTGGYLKAVDFKTACNMMWEKLSDEDKQAVTELPNFDAEVFEETTGIDVSK